MARFSGQNKFVMGPIIFGGWQKFSLIDYPGKASMILFTQGCPFRCPFCHNAELLNASQGMFAEISEENILNFLSKRQNRLDGVVITGGEPTLHQGLPVFMKKIKEMGFLVKLDSNGSNPKMLGEIIREKLVDYIAMDYKAPLEKYHHLVGVQISPEKIRESVNLIMNSGLPHEFRTTAVKELLAEEDLLKIGQEISGAEKYILQKFLPEKTLDPICASMTSYEENELKELCEKLKAHVSECLWR